MALEGDQPTEIRINISQNESAENGENERLRKRRQRSWQKEFKIRNSVLTDLYKINHIRTIYNIFTAYFILLFMNIVVDDLVTHQTLRLNFDMVIWNLQGIEIMVLIWIIMFTYSMAQYACFRIWVCTRKRLLSSKWPIKLWDVFWKCVYIVYHVAFISIPPIFVMKSRLPTLASGVLVMEELRMMMKSHTFVRRNLDNALKTEEDRSAEQNGSSVCPSLTQYLYFHFAPTLLYRDSYPRTEKIRWKIVIWHFCEVLGIFFYCIFTNEQFFFPYKRLFLDEQVTPVRVVALFFHSIFSGLILIILGFYVFLHSWLNAFAELLRFGDRLFYQDWWTTTNFSAYYRSWNVVVHDWIFEYVYLTLNKKFSSLFNNNNKPSGARISHFISNTFTVFISAIFHEYVLIICMRFCYPVMLILFGVFGVALMYVPKKGGVIGNIYMWLCLSIGITILLTAYCVEYFARRYCSPYPNPTLDFFIPRSWTCNATIPYDN